LEEGSLKRQYGKPHFESSLPNLFYLLWKPALFLACFAVYLRTLCPAFLDDDSPETVTAGYTLGLQHPPGYALAALVARCFTLLPVGGVCFRVNIGSAFLSSLVVFLLASIIFKTLKRFSPANPGFDREFLPILCSLSGALLLAFSRTFWEKATGAKGCIYVLGTFLLFLIVFFLTAHETSDDVSRNSKRSPWPFLAAFVFGIGFADHWETHLVFFPLFIAFFFNLTGWKITFIPWPQKSLISLAALWLLGVSPLLYLPLRANLHPALDLGAPHNLSFFIADYFRQYTSGREVGLIKTFFQAVGGGLSWKKLSDLFQFIMGLQGRQILVHFRDEITLPVLILAGAGLWVWFLSIERKIILCLLTSGALLLTALCSASWIPSGPMANWYVDNFLMPINWITDIFAALGLYFLGSGLSKKPNAKILSGLGILLALVLPLLALFSNFADLDLEKQTLRYDYGENLLKSMSRGSVFFAEGDEDYFPLYYLQGVEHRRPDVRMIPSFTLFETWGVAQVESSYPDLGLTASSISFPDHFARIIYATSEIAVKNRDRFPVAFSYFDGAFHRFYLSRNPSLLLRKSGNILELAGPKVVASSVLPFSGLRLRHISDSPSNDHPSLSGIRDIYQSLGLFPSLALHPALFKP
jgi:hypothetical protein